jgi:phage I-like protein
MTALNRSELAKESPMDKELLKALGLPETATAADALAAVNKLKGDFATASNRAETPSLEKFVPRADYDTALARATTAEKSLSDNRIKALDGEIEAEIKAALEAKKITPATADYHKAHCRQEGGLARFREFVKAAPVVAADSGLGGKDPAKGANSGLTEEQLAVCRRMNVKPEDFKAALA